MFIARDDHIPLKDLDCVHSISQSLYPFNLSSFPSLPLSLSLGSSPIHQNSICFSYSVFYFSVYLYVYWFSHLRRIMQYAGLRDLHNIIVSGSIHFPTNDSCFLWQNSTPLYINTSVYLFIYSWTYPLFWTYRLAFVYCAAITYGLHMLLYMISFVCSFC